MICEHAEIQFDQFVLKVLWELSYANLMDINFLTVKSGRNALYTKHDIDMYKITKLNKNNSLKCSVENFWLFPCELVSTKVTIPACLFVTWFSEVQILDYDTWS